MALRLRSPVEDVAGCRLEEVDYKRPDRPRPQRRDCIETMLASGYLVVSGRDGLRLERLEEVNRFGREHQGVVLTMDDEKWRSLAVGQVDW